jgi:VWFA-related protein
MASTIGNRRSRIRAGIVLIGATMVFAAVPAVPAQSGANSNQGQPPKGQQQDIPDAPSTVQPPAPKPSLPSPPPDQAKPQPPAQAAPAPDASQATDEEKQPQRPMPPVETVPAGTLPRNQINPAEDLYKISVSANFVQIPVMVKDSSGRRVDGLLPGDFTVLENGKKQTLTYFTSDPFLLSVAVLLDTGMPDVAVQKVNETYSALVGAFSPYDEVGVYTYSSTVSQVADFTTRSDKVTAILNQMKLVRGHNNGPPILDNPLSTGPTVNGVPVGGPNTQPVNTPPKEAHVLNDAILRAALDLSKRDRARRKVIFVISDGRELGSQASYRDVLKVLESRNIQVKAVVVDSGALPIYRQIEKFRIKGQGYSDILPKYSSATGGGQVFKELTRNSMEDAYAQITSEARNQYTLGYVPKASGGSSAFRDIEVLVDKKDLKISAKTGYYPSPPAR